MLIKLRKKTMFSMRKIHEVSSSEKGAPNTNRSYLDQYLAENNHVGDYYGEDKIKGRWIGKLWHRLGIDQDEFIEKGNKSFLALENNQHPVTGKKLTVRNVKNAVRFYDFTCSAEKSVSILAVTMGDHRIPAIHQAACETALKELEYFAAKQVRDDHGRRLDPQLTGEMIGAMFRHNVSRELDPQLHTHCPIANVTWDSENNRFMALETKEMIKAIRYGGKIYQNEMAKGLRNIGYELENRVENGRVVGFRVKGVSEEICEKFSKRRQQILDRKAVLEKEKGRALTDKELIKVVLETRQNKKHVSPEEVIDYHLDQMTDGEIKNLERAVSGSKERSGKQHPEKTVATALECAVENLFERRSVVRKHEIVSELINESFGIDFEEALKAADTGKDLCSLTGFGQEDKFTTVTNLEQEKWSVLYVNKTIGKCEPVNPEYEAYQDAESLRQEKEEGFDYRQSRKIISNLLKCRDQIMMLRGVAGAGKTTLLKELSRGIAGGSGKTKIIYLAPSSGAVDVLGGEGFKDAGTLQGFLKRPDATGNSLIIIDESSMASNDQGACLLKIARDTGARVLFVGDIRQHSSVDAGDFLRIIETYSDIKKNELTDIHRQRDEQYRQAAEKMASGDVQEGFEILDNMGAIIEDPEYMKRAAEYFFEMTDYGKNLRKISAVAPTNKEVDILNEYVRDKLKKENILDKEEKMFRRYESLQLSRREKKRIDAYKAGQGIIFNREINDFKSNEIYRITEVDKEKGIVMTDHGCLNLKRVTYFDLGELKEMKLSVGDVILSTRNHRKYGGDFINGERLKVTELREGGVVVRNMKGGKTKFLSKDFMHCKYNYFKTSYREQGKTADNVIVAGASMNAVSAYVAGTRGRDRIRVVCPKKSYLFDSMRTTGDREAAFDVARDEVAEKARVKLDAVDARNDWFGEIKARIISTLERKVKNALERAERIRKVFKKQGNKYFNTYRIMENIEKKEKTVSRGKNSSRYP